MTEPTTMVELTQENIRVLSVAALVSFAHLSREGYFEPGEDALRKQRAAKLWDAWEKLNAAKAAFLRPA